MKLFNSSDGANVLKGQRVPRQEAVTAQADSQPGRGPIRRMLTLCSIPGLSARLPTVKPEPFKVAPKQKIDGVVLTTLAAPAGWQLKETKGLYCRFFQYAGTGDYVDKFQAAVEGISEEGKKQGATAFVNVRVSSESREIQGSKWHASVVQICGDFAVLE